MPTTTAIPAITPSMAAPNISIQSVPAVTITRPASEPLRDIDTSGFLYLIHVYIIATIVATAAQRFVVENTEPARAPIVISVTPSAAVVVPSIATVEPPLKPNQQNHRINTPRAAIVRLCPGIALGLPFLSYLPIRGPSIAAPTSEAHPPTICTAHEPAKSWKPISDSQPPPHIQCPEIGYTTREITAL